MTSPTLSRIGWPLALLVTTSLALGACRKDEEKTEKKAETTASKTSAQQDDGDRTARRAPPEDVGIDVPTEEDFEEAVANQITPETDLQKELDQLEKDITK